MLKLKLQYFGHLIRRVDSLEKTLMLGGIGGRRKRGTTEDEMVGWHHRLNGQEFGQVWELVMDREGLADEGHKSQVWGLRRPRGRGPSSPEPAPNPRQAKSSPCPHLNDFLDLLLLQLQGLQPVGR